MCGITGFIGRGTAADLRRMNNTLIRRGPDAEGYFSDASNRIFIGSRRLAIIDIAGGTQPIANEDGTVSVVLNGEIYNYQGLRKRLHQHTFRTQSDTEAIVHLYEEKGEAFVDELEGMFALALWDGREKKLVLARDRFGEKPLYYAEWDGVFAFGSEIKAVLAHPEARRELDREALLQYLQYEYIPAPQTIFSRVRKLPAGHMMTIQRGAVRIRRYWDIAAAAHSASLSPIPSEEEATEVLDRLLSRAVSRMLVADVPLGIFLSGGIDSSTVAFYASQHAAKRIKTFSIGFQDASFDESSYASRVASRLGTDHTAADFSGRELLEMIPSLYTYLDEPLADPSLLPAALLSRVARERVTVALGGDGADELFYGYPTFPAEKLLGIYRRIPRVVRERVIRRLIDRLPASSRYLALDYRLKRFIRHTDEAPEVRHAAWIGAFSKQDLPLLLADWKPYSRLGTPFPNGAYPSSSPAPDPLTRIGVFYLSHYLQDDILTKADRASMCYSLEVRAPFLDPTLAAFIFSLPSSYKLRGFRTKYLLKRLMETRLGADVVHRRKHGFQPPVSNWLRRELSELVREHLNPETLQKDGIFNPAYVARLIDLHQKGIRDYRKELWTLLVFQLWKSHWYK